VPVGLGARDTLRLEANLPLYGNDIDDQTTVWEANLGWIVKLKKGEFIGRDALVRQREQGVARKLAGFEMNGRAVARHGYPVWFEGRAAGQVTSGSYAPFLKKNIGLAYLPPEAAEPGVSIEVEIRGRREPAVVVPTPFYARKK
jgi:aminomethyltransferase